ncbi:MAG: amidohydrolase, partial [Bacteroidetes bacterium]
MKRFEQCFSRKVKRAFARTLAPVALLGLCCLLAVGQAGAQDLNARIDQLAAEVEQEVVNWRRHIHENPELSNREFKTAEYIAQHLRSLGIEVQTGVAHTGVVGILRGGKPGPVVALRADMDALPVSERVELPFASKVRSTYNGQEVGVMHACGHDTHVAILLGTAKVLSQIRDQLPGTVKFIFQPAEEGAPPGEEGGAKLMVKEGVLKNPDVEVIFGLHINSQTEVGKITYRPGGTLAAADRFTIKIKGKQTHGSAPWSGADPIVAAAQVIMGLQTIISREVPLTENAAVVTVGSIHGGVRNNIIPEEVELIGTIRTLDTDMQQQIHQRIRHKATTIAQSMNCTAEVNIFTGVPVTYNDPPLTRQMLPTLQAVAGQENVLERKAITGAEDFSFYQEQVPGLFFFLGGMPKGKNPAEAAPHHTPDFYIDDSGLLLGVRAMSRLALDYMLQKAGR